MNRILALSIKQLIIFSITLAIVLSLIPLSFILPLFLLVLLYFFYKLKKNIFLVFIIISYLLISSENFENYRLFINLFTTSILLIAFIKEFGLDFKRYPRLPIGLLYFIIFLMMTLLTSSVFSSYKLSSFTATLRMLVFLFICYLIFTQIKNSRDIYTLANSLILVMVLSFIPILIDLNNLGIQNYFIRGLLVEKYDLFSAKGYTGVTLFFIVLNLLIALLIKNFNKNLFLKSLIVFLILINISLLILANSRGGILAAFIACSVMLLTLKPKLFYNLILLFVFSFTLIFILSNNFRDAFEFYLRWDTISDRLVYWNMGLEIINDNTIFGIGADTFDKYFFNYSPSANIRHFDSKLMNLGKPHPHNFFLYYFAENGILGLLTGIYFFGVFFYYSVTTFKLCKKLNSDYIILVAAIISIGIGLLVRSFFEVTGYLMYGFITRDLPFWLLLIMLFKINSQLKTEDKKK